jgi:sucrose-6-phosphate hydrolase SacC (GH32 family)
MQYHHEHSSLLRLLTWSALFQASVLGKIIARTADCHSNHYPGPTNPSFENGLTGWTVLSGDAFGSNSVSSAISYWGGPFNVVGNSFLWGFAQSGDAGTGSIRSSSFKASSVMSFEVGGGWDAVNLYVGLVRESDGKILLNQTGPNDEAMIRIVWDTSPYAGQSVHMLVYDNSTAGFGHINLDDIRTGCDALGDGGLNFNLLGQVNQPDKSTSTLSTAQIYAADPVRPQFHYTPYQGWINDPCALIQWNGRYQLFSQFNPAAPFWGPMHWSHVDSADAVHWRELPVALYPPYPDNPSDTSGRFTGSALLDKNTGALQVIFTDATDVSLHPGALPEVVSSASSTDGITFAYYGGNPIIAAPPSGSPSGFRDPKVFWDPIDNTWKMVVGSGDATSGKVQLFVSTNPIGAGQVSWNYVGVLYEGDGSSGTMWECPNFFPIGDKWVLFYGGNSVGWYHVGTYNGTNFISEKMGLADAGPDSYAMQWYVDNAGRNLAVTWMGNWPTSKWPSRVNGWAGVQSITRELFIRDDGGLGSKAIAELSTLATGSTTKMGLTNVHGTITVGSSNMARLQMTVDLASTNAPSFNLTLFSSSAEEAVLMYTVATSTLILDTTNAGWGQAGTWQTAIAVPSTKLLTFDIFIDRSSAEVFVGDGTVMTATIYPRYQESKDINIISCGGKTVFNNISLTPLGSTWA